MLAFSLTASVAACPAASAIPAFAATQQNIYDSTNTTTVYDSGKDANTYSGQAGASSNDTANNTATGEDLANADIIDLSKTASLTIHKYDITAAESAGVYSGGDWKATGEADEELEDTLSNFGVEGVGFTILRVGNVETYSMNNGDSNSVTLVYEIPVELQEILNVNGSLPASEAIETKYETKSGAGDGMTNDNVANKCSDASVLHYTSTQISEALAEILESDNVSAKNALESYLRTYNTIDNGNLTDPEDVMEDDLTDEDYDDEVGSADMSNFNSSELIELDLTDSTGMTSIDGLALGLYLVVETTVPEEITDTVNPFFVELPFTNTSDTDDTGEETSGEEHDADGVTDTNAGGEKWLYDMVVYPKNQSGNPTVDKSVRNAYSNSTEDYGNGHNQANTGLTTGNKNGTVENDGNDYDAALDSTSLIVYNPDTNSAMTSADTDDDAYVANRGGYTGDGITAGAGGAGYSVDFEYRDTTTASEGDVLDYIIVSKLPNITSQATYITEYTFTDVLAAGITYNRDARVAFYDNADDANANNTENAILIWDVVDTDGEDDTDLASQTYIESYSKEYTGVYDRYGSEIYNKIEDGSHQMTFRFTEAGLKVLNNVDDAMGEDGEIYALDGTLMTDGLRNMYMVVYYTATVNSDDSVVLGDEGNANNVVLTYERTSSGYYSQLNDRNYVYSYALDLTKEFSDGEGDPTAVQFKLYNATDSYYVVAEKSADGIYYVTGKSTDKEYVYDSNTNTGTGATTFVPAADGTLKIYGLEADDYTLTEVATDDGYKILGEQININISATDRDIIAAVEGVVGLTQDEADENVVEAIISTYNNGIYDENGNLINDQSSDIALDGSESISYSATEEANGRTLGGTDMFVGEIAEAHATVDGVTTTMASHTTVLGADPNQTEITSEDATVVLTVTNSRNFLLPQTGGYGLYLITIIGVAVAAGGIYMVTRKNKKVQA